MELWAYSGVSQEIYPRGEKLKDKELPLGRKSSGKRISGTGYAFYYSRFRESRYFRTNLFNKLGMIFI
jgi:hypothetical protein